MVDRVLADVTAKGDCPDFVLCIGDDRSDEDMFLAMEHVTFSPHMPAEVIAPNPDPFPILPSISSEHCISILD